MARRTLKKRLLRSAFVIWPLAVLLSVVVRLLYATQRVRYHIPPLTQPIVRGTQPAIFCFWHGRMIFQPFLNPRMNPRIRMHVLISRHSDGRMISALIRCFGVGTVEGSKSRGGAKAMRAMMDIAQRGENIAITPDGPRGPLQQAVEGAAYLAAKSGYMLVPVAFSASRHWRFKSWDRFMLPKPFSRTWFVAGDPITVPADADADALKKITATLQTQLNHVTAEADTRCGIAA